MINKKPAKNGWRRTKSGNTGQTTGKIMACLRAAGTDPIKTMTVGSRLFDKLSNEWGCTAHTNASVTSVTTTLILRFCFRTLFVWVFLTENLLRECLSKIEPCLTGWTKCFRTKLTGWDWWDKVFGKLFSATLN